MKKRIVPWLTDGSVVFLRRFLSARRKEKHGQAHILEFGMGASTTFFAVNADHVVSIEHDQEWYTAVLLMLKANKIQNTETHLAIRPYWERLSSIAGDRRFDVVSIDGRDRVDCLAECLRLDVLRGDGVLIIDNTERITGDGGRYARMTELLAGTFHMIHFEQSGPDQAGWKAPHRWITTVAWRASSSPLTTAGLPL